MNTLYRGFDFSASELYAPACMDGWEGSCVMPLPRLATVRTVLPWSGARASALYTHTSARALPPPARRNHLKPVLVDLRLRPSAPAAVLCVHHVGVTTAAAPAAARAALVATLLALVLVV